MGAYKLKKIIVLMGMLALTSSCTGLKVSNFGKSSSSSGSTTVASALPPLPTLKNANALVNGHSATITFDPVDDALDYRVYELPADGSILVNSDGSLAGIKNTVYRCAGNREAPSIVNNDEPGPFGVRAVIDSTKPLQDYLPNTTIYPDAAGYKRTPAEVTLGYVYTSPGPGLIPVYDLGDPNTDADMNFSNLDSLGHAYRAQWSASRTKKYTIDAAERSALITARWRDDGIAFYVPASAGANTQQVYTTTAPGTGTSLSRYYYIPGAEFNFHGAGNSVAAFLVLNTQVPDSKPLMRVMYLLNGGRFTRHDELVAGQAMFNRVYHQGTQPMFDVHWSGITKPTQLVVEALDTGCPYQGGLLGPKSLATATLPNPDGVQFLEAWFTIPDFMAKDPLGEVFVNGQNDSGVKPHPLARAFINVSPQPMTMDWTSDFTKPQGTYIEPIQTGMFAGLIDCGNPISVLFANGYQNCGGNGAHQLISPTYNTSFFSVEEGSSGLNTAPGSTSRYGFGNVLGELVDAYTDAGCDVGGKFRIAPLTKATLSDNSFLHATMEVNSTSTPRRYPQIIISNQGLPVQWSLFQQNDPNGNPIALTGQTIIIEEIYHWPSQLKVEICDSRPWEVNNQCPYYDFYYVGSPDNPTAIANVPEVAEHNGSDRATRFDVYLSTSKLYLYLDNLPYGCVNLPNAAPRGPAAGPVSVTFGDTVYHTSADAPFGFHLKHMNHETIRHYDNLGYSSNVAAPAWDENIHPCVSNLLPSGDTYF